MAPKARPRLRSCVWWLAAALALPACGAKVSAPPEPPAAVRRGDDAFRYQDYEAAIAAYRAHLDQVGRGPYTARTFYKSALAQYRLGRYQETVATLDEMSVRYPQEHWVQAEALRGDAEAAMGHRTAALHAWDAAWKVSGNADRPQLRERILRTARQLNGDELEQARRAVNTKDVARLLEDQKALRQARENEPVRGEEQQAMVPEELPPGIAPAEAPVVEVPARSEAGPVRSEAAQAPGTTPSVFDRAAAEAGQGFGPAPGWAATAGVPEEPLQGVAKVGCLLPLSGPARLSGQQTLRGLRLVFGADGDRLLVKDTKGDPVAAAEMLEELARDPNVLVVVGPSESEIARAVAPRAEQAHLPLVLLARGDEPKGEFIIQAAIAPSHHVGALLDYAMEKVRLHRFGVLYPKDVPGKEMLEMFRTEVERRGGTVVGTEAYPPGVKQVTTEVRLIKKWRDAQHLQAVFLPDGATTAAALARSLQESMPDVTLLGVHGWEGLAQQDGAVNGVLFAESFYGGSAREGTRVFVEAFRHAYGDIPGATEAEAYDAALLVRRALDAGAGSRPALLRRLFTLGPIEAATGELQVTAEGVRRRPFLLQVYDGKLQELATRPG